MLYFVAMTERAKKILLITLILLSVLPAFTLAGSPKADWLYLSSLSGFIGTALILWQYILGTRSITGLYFNELPWVTRLHVLFGIWGSLFIFAHPIAATLLYGKSLTYSFVLDFSSGLESSISYGRIAFLFIFFIWATSALFRKFFSYRLWKYLHYLAYASLPFVFFHAPRIGTSFVDQAAYAYWYSLVAVFAVFTVVRLRMFLSLGRAKYKVSKITKLNGHVVLLQLSPQRSTLRIKPGQYVYLRHSMISESHPFSVAHHNKRTGDIFVAFKVFGKYTNELTKAERGASMYIDGPYGAFTEAVNTGQNQATVFIAGGIGITPFIMHLYNPAFKNKHLFYANRQRNNANFVNNLRKELGQHLHEFYSDDSANTSSYPRKITVSEIQKHVTDWKNAQYFICGPTQMMKQLRENLKTNGVKPSNIHIEEFSF